MFRFCALALLIATFATTGYAQTEKSPSFTDALLASRMAISIDGEKLAGPGGDVIRAATADAQYVLLGEDHGIAQIPQFATALCTELASHGFRRLDLEISPSVAPVLENFARANDGPAQFVAFNQRYPDAIAFYTWREEFEFLRHCESSSSQGFELRGLDQDFMGDSTYVLAKIAEMNLSADVRAAIAKLIEEDKNARATAEKSGNPYDLFLLSAKPEELDAARELLRRDGPAQARGLFDGLLESRSIYSKYQANQGYESNRQRAVLMKRTFHQDFTASLASQKRDSAPPKVFFKFGAYHLGRGMNGLHSSEIGDYVAEMAEGRGQKSVHIMIFGVKGTQSAFAGIGKPYAESPLDLPNDKDSALAWAKPLYGNLLDGSWTMFNLRSLRDHFGRFTGVDPELERIIFAYDFVVLIPQVTASHGLAAAK
jgi:hypothetical protein